MEKQLISSDYYRLNTLRERVGDFLKNYPWLSLPDRHISAAILLAQVYDGVAARRLREELTAQIKGIYHPEIEDQEGKGSQISYKKGARRLTPEEREKVDSLKARYLETIQELSVLREEYSEVFLLNHFTKEWNRGLGVASRFIENLDKVLLGLPNLDDEIDNKLSL